MKYEELEKIIQNDIDKCKKLNKKLELDIYLEVQNWLKDTFQKKRIDCMTCKHFDRWSDSCPFCQYEYDENTDCKQRVYAGVIEK